MEQPISVGVEKAIVQQLDLQKDATKNFSTSARLAMIQLESEFYLNSQPQNIQLQIQNVRTSVQQVKKKFNNNQGTKPPGAAKLKNTVQKEARAAAAALTISFVKLASLK